MISLYLVSSIFLLLQYVSQLYNMYLVVCLNMGSWTLLSTFLMAFLSLFRLCICIFVIRLQ